MRIDEIRDAEGLDEKDRDLVETLMTVWSRKLKRNRLRVKYYEDKNELKNLGLAVPREFIRSIDTSTGWIAKSVDMLSSRSRYDGITLAQPSDKLDSILDENRIRQKYMSAVSSELIHGCGFWAVSNDNGKVRINYHDALSASGIWDYAHDTIKAGMYVADMGYDKAGRVEPVKVVVETDEKSIIIEKINDIWYATSYPHLMGRPLMEAMRFRPSIARPFGKSRITRASMGIVDEMQREIVRTALHSEAYAAPQKYLLGASEEAFEKSKFSLYMDSIFLATKDQDGDVPAFGQLPSAPITSHIEAQQLLMSKMAAETNCPVAAFGLSSNGYTSSDALRASTDDLIIEAESLNAYNGEALRNVAMMALAMAGNKSLANLDENERSAQVHWKNPSMPSIASQTDAMVKQASVCDWLPETDVYWEMLGYNEEQRRRIDQERKTAQSTAVIQNAIFGGK